jgi:DNA-binding PadR family transcriptional regulator
MQRATGDVFAPKGLLKILILKIASEKPVTGTDIMREVPRMTDNAWKPSAGSVYYLLAELEKDDLIIHVPTGEAGIKRYICSEKGKLNLDSFKIDARRNLQKQIVILKILSDLSENNCLSDGIQDLSRKIAS